MNSIYGLIMLAVATGMVLAARPRYGKSPRFLGSWVVGQIYVLACLVCSVLGLSLVIRSLPPVF